MAGTSRFHDKMHRSNHHSVATPGLPDSAYDPIASADAPFRGDFVLSGALSAHGGGNFDSVLSRNTLVAQGATTLNSTLAVSGTSTFYNTIQTNYLGGVMTTDSYPANTSAGTFTLNLNYNKGVYINGTFGSAPKLILGTPGVDAGLISATNISSTSALITTLNVPGSAFINQYYTNSAVISTLSTLDGAYVGGRLGVGTYNPQHSVHIIGDMVIYGDLTANGTSNFQNTTFTTTSALSIVNTGTGAALTVSQEGNQAIAAFYDHESSIGLWIDGDVSRPGWVGVKTKTPNVELTVLGSISASNQIFGTLDGSYVVGSNKWNSVYNTTSATSATWNTVTSKSNIGHTHAISDVIGLQSALNGKADSSHTHTASQITDFNSSVDARLSTINTASAKWESNYSTTNSNSAKWESNYTTTNTNSSLWSSVYTSVLAASATWDAAVGGLGELELNSLTDVIISSPNANNILIYDLGMNQWINSPALSDVMSTSANWNSSYNTVNALSTTWNLPGVTALSALSDTNIIGPSNNQLLLYDNTTKKWTNNSTFAGTFTANNINLASATVNTYSDPLIANGDFLVLRINGVDRKIQLWD